MIRFAAYNDKTQRLASVLPEWPAGAANRMVANIFDLKAALTRHSPGIRFGAAKDSSYVVVPSSLIGTAVAFTLRELAAQGISYGSESWDCEDFVNELDTNLRKMARRAGITASPLTCCLSVQQQIAWANVDAGGWHAVSAVMTEVGVIVVESQNGISVPLDAYPNRSIMQVADNL